MKQYIKSETDDFIKRAVNFGQRNGLNIPELALAFSDGRRCSHEDYLKLCKWFRNQENVDRYYSGVELTSSHRPVKSSQKGFENVAEGTRYDDYHIDTTGMGILDVEHIINEIEGRGNQAVLTVKTSDGATQHTQFNAKDWKAYKDAVNGVDEFSRNSGTKGAAITDVWVTEVEGGSYVRNSRKITSTRANELTEQEKDDLYEIEKNEAEEHYNSLDDSDKQMLRVRYGIKNVKDYVKFFIVHPNKLSDNYEFWDDDPRTKLNSRQIKSGWERTDMASGPIWDKDNWRIIERRKHFTNGDEKYYLLRDKSHLSKEDKKFDTLAEAMDYVDINIESSRRPCNSVHNSRQIKSSKYRWTPRHIHKEDVEIYFNLLNNLRTVSPTDATYELPVGYYEYLARFCEAFNMDSEGKDLNEWYLKTTPSVIGADDYFEVDTDIIDSITFAMEDYLTDGMVNGIPVESSRKITSSRYIATDPESGEVLGSADTYEEAVNEWGEDVTITDSEAAEGQEEDMELFQSRKITSAVDGGWEVRSSDVPEALDLFVEYFGEEDALEQIAKAMGDNVLQENIEWIAQQWGFGEEIEDLDVWEQYETAKEYMGVSELFNNLTQAAGYDELAEDLAFIFRMNDFREWDKYDNEDSDGYDEDEEEIESSLQNSFPIRTVKHIMSGAWTEEQAAQNIAEKQDINVGYARQILSSWIEQYKPKLIKSGILDVAEDINTEFDIDGDLESWAEQYTNREGKSNTIGGEMVRAAMQIIYRYNNDGDMIGRGYGNETVNAAARYITEKAEMGVNEQIQKWLDHEERADDYDYDNFIETFTTEIEQILRENPELFQKPNKDDYWDWKEDEDVNYGLDECYLDDGNGNQYWFQLNNDRWACTRIELDPNRLTYQEGDTINEGDEYSDEIDHTEEFGSFEADGFIYEYAGNESDDSGEYISWQITKVIPADPYCDEGDTFDFYDFEPDELYGYTLYDYNGNEVDERTFLASSLIKSNITAGDEVVIEIERHGKWEIVAQSDDERGWTLKGDAMPAIFDNKNEAKNSQLAEDLERDGYSPNKGNMRFKKYS